MCNGQHLACCLRFFLCRLRGWSCDGSPLRRRLQLIEGVNLVARQVAHDIRSPLSALKVLVDDPSIPVDRRAFVRAAVERISATANDLLKTARVTQGGAPIALANGEVVLIQDLLEAAVGEKKVEWKGLDANVSLVYGKEQVFVVASRPKLAAILSNLLNNSIEARAEGRQFEVKVSALDYRKSVVIAIQDNGKGIGEELLPELGKREVSVGKSDGNGLGLFTAYAYIKSVGGDLKISSRPGDGTLVTIELPKAEAKANAIDNKGI